MTNQPASDQIETETCSRCGGSGQYSYCQSYGTTCFKCRGAKRVFTKRGLAANDYLVQLRSLPAKEVVVGQLVRVDLGSPVSGQVRAFATVLRSEMQTEPSSWSVNPLTGEKTPHLHWVLEVENPKHGGLLKYLPPEELVRVGQTAEQKAATLKQALAFQATLTKQGKPRVKISE